MKTSTSKTGKMENAEFHEFFVDELKDIYWAEKHLSQSITKNEKSSYQPGVSSCFRQTYC
jgi:ferritin-like metal-binding protein YciE